MTTYIAIRYSTADFLSSESLKQNKSVHLDLRFTFSLQYGTFLSIVRLCLVLKSSEVLSKNGKAKLVPFQER